MAVGWVEVVVGGGKVCCAYVWRGGGRRCDGKAGGRLRIEVREVLRAWLFSVGSL